ICDRRIDEDCAVVRDDVSVDRDLDLLSVLDEPPAIHGTPGSAQVDAVVRVQITRMQRRWMLREVRRRAHHHEALVRADANGDPLAVEAPGPPKPRGEPS